MADANELFILILPAVSNTDVSLLACSGSPPAAAEDTDQAIPSCECYVEACIADVVVDLDGNIRGPLPRLGGSRTTAEGREDGPIICERGKNRTAKCKLRLRRLFLQVVQSRWRQLISHP